MESLQKFIDLDEVPKAGHLALYRIGAPLTSIRAGLGLPKEKTRSSTTAPASSPVILVSENPLQFTDANHILFSWIGAVMTP